MWYSQTAETTAPPRRVWEVWTDVERWPAWDPELREASLDDATFEAGARGTLRPRVGPPAPFVVTDCEDVRSFCYAVDLPLAELDVRRSLHSHDGGTTFVHEVWFEGPLAGLYSRTLGRRYRRALPEAMAAVRERAEGAATTGSSTDTV
jgi:hypothetical protein